MSFFDKVLTLVAGKDQSMEEPSRVKFYKEASAFGEHGRIVVSSPKYGLKEIEVGFVFVGMTEPPELTLEVHKFINSQALEQGFVPLHLVKGTYGVSARDVSVD